MSAYKKAAVSAIADGLSASVEELRQRLAELTRPGTAANTLRAYESDLRHWHAWCAAIELPALPASADTVALYLAAMLDTLKVATIQRRLWAVGRTHREASLPNPVATQVVQDLLRLARKKRPKPRQVRALTLDHLHLILEETGHNLSDCRDQALLLTLWTAALRRSEAVALNVEDLAWDPPGAAIWLAHSKTDQEGTGRTIPIPAGPDPDFCPTNALRRWLRRARISSGPLFRAVDQWQHVSPSRLSDRAVALIVKARCAAAGLDPAEFSGHSPRSGFATTTDALGIDRHAAMAVTGHTSLSMFERYVRPEKHEDAAALAMLRAEAHNLSPSKQTSEHTFTQEEGEP